MPRSKSIHFVTKTYTVTQPDDSSTTIFSGENQQVDLALELSNTLGRQIRQGQTFRVIGAQAHLHATAGDEDTGFSVAMEASYIPTTAHARKAWNNVFKQWKGQKRLAGKVGAQIRYDDLEYAYTASAINNRTSSIYGSGIGDTSPESLVLVGSSTAGTDFSLQDYYNSAFETPEASRDHFTNVTIKAPKFDSSPFPAPQTLKFGASWSSMVDTQSDPDALGGGINLHDFQFFPADNHINVMCGLFFLNGYVLPPDTVFQNADTLSLSVTFAVEGWSPLVYKPTRMVPAYRNRKRGKRRTWKKTSFRYKGRRR